MNRRIHLFVLFMIAALLLCEFSLTVTDPSYRIVSDEFSGSGAAQSQSLSSAAQPAFGELGTPELIRSHSFGSLFSIRAKTKGRESQRSFVRLLLLLTLALCFFGAILRHFRPGLLLPEGAAASSVILSFIHSEDGKK
ncbi:MAG: hypothetical protein IJ128_05825 [Firmicutes bacterium]|nr:hypothetical protein [Bacillota bacterium]